MKKINILLVVILACSCQNSKVLEDADFGTAIFREPFRGIFSSRPAWLESTLDWPIMNKLRPDTACLSKQFEIEFNEDAIRSDATATINVQTLDNQPLNGIFFYCNDHLLDPNGYVINSSSEKQTVEIKCKVLPVFTDSLFQGYITISGKDIDEVNTLALNRDTQQPITKWKLNYKLGWSPFWLIWLVILLLIIFAFYGFVKSIVRLWTAYAFSVHIATHPFLNKPSLKSSTSTSGKFSIREYFHNRKNYLLYLNKARGFERVLTNKSSSVTNKALSLEDLRLYLEDIKEKDPEMNQMIYDSLNSETQKALDKLNIEVWRPTPKEGTNGKWLSSNSGHRYRLSESNKFYQECKELGFIECDYGLDGNPNFDQVTYPNTIVDISELYDKYSINALKKRGGGSSFSSSFQDVAQEKIAKLNSSVIQDFWSKKHSSEKFDLYKAYYEWRDSLDLVPHEDGNCRTLRLVKRSAHTVFTHTGGISRVCNVKKYF